MEKSTGEYLMFIDGDEWLEVDCVQYLVDILGKNDADMSMTDSYKGKLCKRDIRTSV